MKKITRRPVFPLDYGVPESLDGTLPWEHITERLKKALHYWVSTVDSNQRPHATPVWGAWVDETLYFDGSPQTKRGRNLKGNPNIAIHLESGLDVLMIHGKATRDHSSQGMALKLSEEYNQNINPRRILPHRIFGCRAACIVWISPSFLHGRSSRMMRPSG